ncbi:hypothetical protein [Actinoplanes sp. URMC 104]|uniref:hypothetical protein n=1 Tax=Actinoplanes sp. URMC 104 TaxID=3423409 RepID=UPI003F1CB4AD
MADLTDTAHQTPGADVSAIREGDRITLLNQPGSVREVGLLVRTVSKQYAHRYVFGRDLNARGKPYARASRGVQLSGPAGGEWDWYRLRKPKRPQRTGRDRVIRVVGDGQPIMRTAKTMNATAEIVVAPVGRGMHLFDHPAIELTVRPDGSWVLRKRSARQDGVERTLVELASGHIDGPPPVKVGVDFVECPYADCKARDRLVEVDSTERWNPSDVTVEDGRITKVVWWQESYGDAEVEQYRCRACGREVSVDLDGAHQVYQ